MRKFCPIARRPVFTFSPLWVYTEWDTKRFCPKQGALKIQPFIVQEKNVDLSRQNTLMVRQREGGAYDKTINRIGRRR